MKLAQRHPAPTCILLGALAACGFAPLQLWPLTLASLAVWMWLVHESPTLKAALWRGWLFGVGHFTINDNWFQHAFDFQDKMPPALGYAAPLALALYIGVYPALAAGLAWRWRGRTIDASYILIFAAAWIATEWLRAGMFTGYAWDPLGVIWVPVQPVAMLSAIVGTYALSGLTVALAGAALLMRRNRWAVIFATLAVLLIAHGLSYRNWTTPPAPRDGAPRLVVVQPNIGNDDRSEAGGDRALAALVRGSGRSGPAPRLVVWPEGLLLNFPESGYPDYVYSGYDPAAVRARIASALGPRDILLTSADTLAFDSDDRVVGAGNSVLAIDARARIIGRYDKAHLVPYGEYLPMPWLLRPLGLARLVPGDMDFNPGPGPRSLTLSGFGAIGVQVCYEIIFSGEVVDQAHRPRLLFNPSNDAWFGRWGPPQHLAQARMRAIEEGLPIVRATPTGISAIIAADGQLLATIPHETAGTIEAPIPEAHAPTPFSRIGNRMAAIIAGALLLAAVAMRRHAR